MKCANLLEGVPGGDGIDEQEPLARAHVLLPHGAASNDQRSAGTGEYQMKWKGVDRWIEIPRSPVLFLTSSVKNIKKGDFIINDTLFSV